MRTLLLLLLFCNNVQASQLTCLAQTLFHEARGEPITSQIRIVGETTFNRAADRLLGGYAAPKSVVKMSSLNVCSVIHERGQYAWVRHTNKIPAKDHPVWALARQLLSKDYYVVTGTRYFNNRGLGKRYATPIKPIIIAAMMAY